jgi:hypothetical protein
MDLKICNLKHSIMKTGYSILILLLFFVSATHAQEAEKKSKEERKSEQQKKTKELVNSKTFLFIGNRAYSEGGKSFTLTSDPNSVSFSQEMIKSNLPFFGTVKTASAGYGTQSGYTFEGKPDEFTIDSTKKGFQVKAVVKTVNEKYTLNLSISQVGDASLNVYSINRSSMRYNGDIRSSEDN